ncbi:DUF4328 domain-containing protein [Streptomyces sp. N2-109]|uniref:DUF4328 domain-containing protein n=1 Tax=Streptomyces gossypii TaxID=2883101 RepID=A0ABT2JNL1_9ACTN|nr:DUF4328 domain-containing protein [Streptomyces gossypii]MCT2589457.1 DUF4328 domain-containing protein [Streptomyces gossypii]
MDRLDAGDPRWIGGYRLLGRLGEGGMGRVYLARSERGRTVAVKAVKAELARHSDFRRRFAQEITAARRVGAQYTAPVLDADTEAAEPWVATGYIAGPSLAEVVDRDFGPLPENSVRALATGLVKALTAIHGAGLIHRDLKPSNVLITIDGPRVIDFGIARALDATVEPSGGLTRTGAVIGSPGFMSPEQVRGQQVTGGSDVFCLGAVLSYAATGRLPFGTADSGIHALMFRIAEEEPDLSGLSGPLHELIFACLAKDPAHRPTLETLAALTQGEITGTWLPGEVLAQLGRHAVQLLDSEDPEAQSAAFAEGRAGTGGAAPAASTPSPPAAPYPSMPAGPGGYPAGGQPGPYGYPHPGWQGATQPAGPAQAQAHAQAQAQTQQATYQAAYPTGYQTGYQGAPAYPVPAGNRPPPPARSARSLSTPAWALLATCLVWMVADFFVMVSVDSSLGELPESLPPQYHSDFESMKDMTQVMEVFGLFIRLGAVALWTQWFYRVRMNAEAFAPGQIRYAAGMAAGTWFIPFCNLFMPKQIANDIWTATNPPAMPMSWYTMRPRTPHGLLNAWWTLWVIYFCLTFMASWESWYENGSIDGASGSLALGIFASLTGVAAAVLAIIFVIRLTKMQDERIRGRIG